MASSTSGWLSTRSDLHALIYDPYVTRKWIIVSLVATGIPAGTVFIQERRLIPTITSKCRMVYDVARMGNGSHVSIAGITRRAYARSEYAMQDKGYGRRSQEARGSRTRRQRLVRQDGQRLESAMREQRLRFSALPSLLWARSIKIEWEPAGPSGAEYRVTPSQSLRAPMRPGTR